MFSLPSPLVAQKKAIPVSLTNLILLGSKHQLVSSRAHISWRIIICHFPQNLKIFRNNECANILLFDKLQSFVDFFRFSLSVL